MAASWATWVWGVETGTSATNFESVPCELGARGASQLSHPIKLCPPQSSFVAPYGTSVIEWMIFWAFAPTGWSNNEYGVFCFDPSSCSLIVGNVDDG